jgi:hypothetical protein
MQRCCGVLQVMRRSGVGKKQLQQPIVLKELALKGSQKGHRGPWAAFCGEGVMQYAIIDFGALPP